MAIVNDSPVVEASGAGDLDTAGLFAIVWDAIAEVLGTAATAAIVRRAAGRVAIESPELVDLVIRRERLEYRYTLPHAWSHPAGATTPEDRMPIAFQALVGEIGRLLVELPGTVFIGRLVEIPELRARGLVWRAGGAN